MAPRPSVVNSPDSDDSLLAPIPAARVLAALQSALESAEREKVGSQIGSYKLLQKIGEGGFGTVWMAEQLTPIRRRVALKVVKVGMDTDEVIARFEVERQALALMDHPNIARVFDAGATASGRPYFVMELVRGVAITRYCDDNRLTAEDRLHLFVAVCKAVQHAHQKGIIHRDLKPSNILVTLADGVPIPKVIDFGIAKATDKQLTEKTLVTQFHAFVGTPAYTSPEQMEMSALDVDTRSDIYSLGVLLYELLAGRPPFDPEALVKSGLDAMRRTIREVDPPRPSTRLRTLPDEARTSIAGQRSTDAAKLSLLLRGDLDWIAMRCLEKDRTRRYETANALARDVERHLTHEPVSARPPSTSYRIRKFVRRHRLGVTSTAAVALSLVAALIASSSLFVRERAARQRAVAAEKSEEKLRQQAEAARVDEARQASRTSIELAEQLFATEGRAHEALAQLVRAARSDPSNSIIGPRLVSALAYRSFPEPIGATAFLPAAVRWIAATPDGQDVVAAAGDDRLHVCDFRSGRLRHAITVPESRIFVLSPDGSRVAVGQGDGVLNIWDIATGRRALGPLQFGKGRDGGRMIGFSPDQRWLVASNPNRTTTIWNTATGHPQVVLEVEPFIPAFSPDGGRLLLTEQRRAGWGIWTIPDGDMAVPKQEPYRNLRANAAQFTPDGKLVVVTDNFGAQLHDASTGQPIGARLAHKGPSYFAIFSSDGKALATTSDDGTAQLWEVPSGRPLLPPMQHRGKVHQPLFTPDGRRLVTYADDGLARVWDLSTGRLAMEPIRAGHITALTLSHDGNEVITGGADGAVRRWRIADSAIVPYEWPADPGRIGLRIDPGGTTGWVLYRDRLQKVDLATGDAIGRPREFPVHIVSGTLSRDRKTLGIFTAATEAGGEIWDLSGLAIVRRPFSRGPGTVTWSPDCSYLVTFDASAGVLHLWHVATHTVHAVVAHATRHFHFSHDSLRLAAALADHTVLILELATGKSHGAPLRHQAVVSSVEFCPDNRLVVTADGIGLVQLWDVATHQPIGRPIAHPGLVRRARFSHDGRRLVTLTPLQAQVWDVATQSPLTDAMTGGNDLNEAIFSENNSRIATFARTGREVRIWDTESARVIADPINAAAEAFGNTFSFIGGGRFFVVGDPGANSVVRVYPVPPEATRPVPDWLLRLATGFAAGEIDAKASFRARPVEAATYDALREELASLPVDAPYVEWGRWVLADRATRPLHPGLGPMAAATSTPKPAAVP
jgi:eukaryotic-like serine/threonine-protein kinase